jgi:hypothetical protein
MKLTLYADVAALTGARRPVTLHQTESSRESRGMTKTIAFIGNRTAAAGVAAG